MSTLTRIPARHPLRARFAAYSTGSPDGTQGGAGRVDYYDTKGAAVDAFSFALDAFSLHFDSQDCMYLPGNEGWKTLLILDANDNPVGDARLTWYRVPSGRYEFTGYIA